MKTLDTLVRDVYQVLQTKDIPESVDFEAALDSFADNLKKTMRNAFSERKDGRTLRMSNIGRKDRFLWHVVNKPNVQEELAPNNYIKFLYGHLIEEMLLFLVKVSGHEVSDEQKLVDVNGIKGSMDCKIDGVVVDVKSTSTFGFKKFKEATLAYDDPFGYIGQLKGYAKAEGQTSYAWLAMDKQNGHLCVLKYDETDTQAPVHSEISYDIEERIDHIRTVTSLPEPPEPCYPLEPDGKSGNMKLAIGCSYCPYKHECWKGLRAFRYSNGIRYLAEVVNEPKVQEIELL